MSKRQLYLPIIIAVSLVAGIFISSLITEGNTGFLKQEKDAQNKLNAMLDFISENYVDTINKAELIEDAIPTFLEKLDPHSLYIPAKNLKEMNEPLQGNFEGIGIQFNMRHDTLLVLHTISGGPSEAAGVRPGDRIITVDDSVIAGKNISTHDIMKMLKGEKGTKVKLGIKRGEIDSLIYYTIVRDDIPLYSVDVSYMPGKATGCIKISTFSNKTYSEFMSAVKKLKAKGMTNLILDLRSNSGGIMDAANRITDEFLRDGNMIVYTQGRKHGKTEIYATDKHNSLVDVDLAVLIDEFSASASEIVAGAIQDNDRGWIIGRRSFGKGLVQEPVNFNDGSALRLTVARYHTPSGRCIQRPYKDGIEDYYQDVLDRYLNGEMLKKDSVKLNDSLKYTTTNGRIVYGGGGIMPDIFVPVDTTGNSELYRQIQNKNLVYEFAFKYTEQHRSRLAQHQNITPLVNDLEDHKLFHEFLSFVEENGIIIKQKQLGQSKKTLKTQVYAMISRNILSDDGFYPVIHQVDTTFKKAFQVMEEDWDLMEYSGS
ncbi:MAG: S41 family peptidase [Candidatus Delongbacteria bacterium]|jgi:carboxyl-terminal processing protease|nr:S41 family peptidase [Candidatus Delongbacteria bacterium]